MYRRSDYDSIAPDMIRLSSKYVVTGTGSRILLWERTNPYESCYKTTYNDAQFIEISADENFLIAAGCTSHHLGDQECVQIFSLPNMDMIYTLSDNVVIGKILGIALRHKLLLQEISC